MSRRLFIALDAPASCRAVAREAREALSAGFPGLRVRWQPPENLHLTLAFLGNIDGGAVADCATRVEACASRATRFELETAQLDAFPSVRRPSVIWLGIRAHPPHALASLERDVAHAFRHVRGDSRPFRAHITLGRVKDLEAVDRGGLAEALAALPRAEASWSVDRLILYASVLASGGAVHTEVAAGTIPA